MTIAELGALELSALLCSRVCHDIISPVGAVINGLEVLEEDNGDEMRGFADDLIRKSANQASAKLQFARLAFGAAGSAGAEIDSNDAEAVARAFVDKDKIALEWGMPPALLPKNKIKLLLNLLVIATHTIPRGGQIRLSSNGNADAPDFTLECTGIGARIPENVEALLHGNVPSDGIDAHRVQPYYTGLLARQSAMTVSFELKDETVTIRAGARA